MNVQVQHCSEGVAIENLKRPTVSTKSWVEMPTIWAILDAWPLLSPYFARRSDKGWDFRQQKKKKWAYITQRLEPFDVDLSCFWRQSVTETGWFTSTWIRMGLAISEQMPVPAPFLASSLQPLTSLMPLKYSSTISTMMPTSSGLTFVGSFCTFEIWSASAIY